MMIEENFTVVTLERLCYFNKTASKAFKLLYKLAIKDNSLTSDAIPTFVNLFGIAHAETVLDFDSRLQILEEIEKEYGISEIIIGAYEKALKTHSFTGQIRSNSDRFERNPFITDDFSVLEAYHISSIKKLTGIYENSDDLIKEKVKETLIFRLPDQILYGAWKEMLNAVRNITLEECELDPLVRQHLMNLQSKRYGLDQIKLSSINNILEEYKPKDIDEELKAYVINAPWIVERNDSGDYINISEERAKNLANKYLEANNVNIWLPHLQILLKGDQKQTFAFASIIGESTTIDKQLIIEELIKVYRSISIEDQNESFIRGFVYGANQDNFTRYSINCFLKEKETEKIGISLIRLLDKIEFNDLESIKSVLADTPDYLRNLDYIDVTHLVNSEIIALVEWLKEINPSFTLELLMNVDRKNENRWQELASTINKLLYVDGILQYRSFTNSSFHILDLFKRSINNEPGASKVEFLVKQIIKEYDDFDYIDKSLLDNLTYFLLTDYWEISWSIIGDYLSKDLNNRQSMVMFLSRYKFDNALLLEWSYENKESFPPVAIQFMNIYKKEDDESLSWDTNAKQIINDFGDDNKVLNKLHSKFISYSLIGQYSAAGLYKKRIVLVHELLEHPIPKVKEFAKKMMRVLEERIGEEKREGENYELDF